MSILIGKKVLLGISGGIAAYKTPLLVRALIKKGAEVKIVMTPAALDFVTPLTLSTLSNHPVVSSFTQDTDQDHPSWNNHVDLALWADIMLIAPATSNTISAMANAQCNNLLLACYLSAKCPVYLAPAMDLDMYAHPANTTNMSTIAGHGVTIFPAQEGYLASGLEGKGRMMEPDAIVNALLADLKEKAPLHNKKVLITAGPTFEPIDPVRFIGNHSSGKMGYALAEEAAQLGAEVWLISGPTHCRIDHPAVHSIPVLTAAEMAAAVFAHYEAVDIAIAAAAVADFAPAQVASQKIKKEKGLLSIPLSPTVDILAEMGKKKKHQFLLGFALETDNELSNAKKKCRNKNLDAIVLNSLRDAGAGFGGDQNKITYISKNNTAVDFSLKTKRAVAKDIFKQILSTL